MVEAKKTSEETFERTTTLLPDGIIRATGKNLIRVKYGPSKWAASTYDGGLLWITVKNGMLMVLRSKEGDLFAAAGKLVCVVDLGLEQVRAMSTEDMLRLTATAVDWENLDETFDWNLTDSIEEVADANILGRSFFDG